MPPGMAAREKLAAGPGRAAAAGLRHTGDLPDQAGDQNSVESLSRPPMAAELLPLPFDISGYTDERQYNVQLQQSVFSWANWKTLSRAHKQVAQAEADYKAAQESLIQRVATAYFNVLAAQDVRRCRPGRPHRGHPAARAGQQALRRGPDPDHRT